MGGCDSDCDCCDKDLVIGLAIVVGIPAALILIAVLAAAYGFPRHVAVAVDDASLTRFRLLAAPATAFAYNLTASLAIRNRNWAMRVRYRSLEADYLFDGQRFDRVQVLEPGYVQPPRKTNLYHFATGSDGAYVALGNAGVAAFEKANATGVFDVEVALRGEVKYQAHTTWCNLEASCPLKLQLAPPGTAAVVFERVKCKVAKPENNQNC